MLAPLSKSGTTPTTSQPSSPSRGEGGVSLPPVVSPSRSTQPVDEVPSCGRERKEQLSPRSPGGRRRPCGLVVKNPSSPKHAWWRDLLQWPGSSNPSSPSSPSSTLSPRPKEPSSHLQWAKTIREEQAAWHKHHRSLMCPASRRKLDSRGAPFALTGSSMSSAPDGVTDPVQEPRSEWVCGLRAVDKEVHKAEKEKALRQRKMCSAQALKRLETTQQEWRRAHDRLEHRRRRTRLDQAAQLDACDWPADEPCPYRSSDSSDFCDLGEDVAAPAEEDGCGPLAVVTSSLEIDTSSCGDASSSCNTSPSNAASPKVQLSLSLQTSPRMSTAGSLQLPSFSSACASGAGNNSLAAPSPAESAVHTLVVRSFSERDKDDTGYASASGSGSSKASSRKNTQGFLRRMSSQSQRLPHSMSFSWADGTTPLSEEPVNYETALTSQKEGQAADDDATAVEDCSLSNTLGDYRVAEWEVWRAHFPSDLLDQLTKFYCGLEAGLLSIDVLVKFLGDELFVPANLVSAEIERSGLRTAAAGHAKEEDTVRFRRLTDFLDFVRTVLLQTELDQPEVLWSEADYTNIQNVFALHANGHQRVVMRMLLQCAQDLGLEELSLTTTDEQKWFAGIVQDAFQARGKTSKTDAGNLTLHDFTRVVTMATASHEREVRRRIFRSELETFKEAGLSALEVVDAMSVHAAIFPQDSEAAGGTDAFATMCKLLGTVRSLAEEEAEILRSIIRKDPPPSDEMGVPFHVFIRWMQQILLKGIGDVNMTSDETETLKSLEGCHTFAATMIRERYLDRQAAIRQWPRRDRLLSMIEKQDEKESELRSRKMSMVGLTWALMSATSSLATAQKTNCSAISESGGSLVRPALSANPSRRPSKVVITSRPNSRSTVHRSVSSVEAILTPADKLSDKRAHKQGGPARTLRGAHSRGVSRSCSRANFDANSAASSRRHSRSRAAGEDNPDDVVRGLRGLPKQEAMLGRKTFRACSMDFTNVHPQGSINPLGNAQDDKRAIEAREKMRRVKTPENSDDLVQSAVLRLRSLVNQPDSEDHGHDEEEQLHWDHQQQDSDLGPLQRPDSPDDGEAHHCFFPVVAAESNSPPDPVDFSSKEVGADSR